MCVFCSLTKWLPTKHTPTSTKPCSPPSSPLSLFPLPSSLFFSLLLFQTKQFSLSFLFSLTPSSGCIWTWEIRSTWFLVLPRKKSRKIPGTGMMFAMKNVLFLFHSLYLLFSCRMRINTILPIP